MLGLRSRPEVVHRQAYEGLDTSVLSGIIKKPSLGSDRVSQSGPIRIPFAEARRPERGDGVGRCLS